MVAVKCFIALVLEAVPSGVNSGERQAQQTLRLKCPAQRTSVTAEAGQRQAFHFRAFQGCQAWVLRLAGLSGKFMHQQPGHGWVCPSYSKLHSPLPDVSAAEHHAAMILLIPHNAFNSTSSSYKVHSLHAM